MNKENFSLVYFISRAFFAGSIYSLMLNLSGSDSILSCIIGITIGLIIIYLINKMNFNKDKFKLIQICFYLFLITLSITTIETYINQFLLTNTPKIIVIIPAIILCLYTSFKNINSIKRTSFILIIISIFLFILMNILLTSYIDINNILPIFNNKITNIFKSSLIFGVLSSTPNILLKEENIPLKKHLKYYLIVSLLNTFICFLIISILTTNVAKLYSFPEYMILKRIKVFEFIENVENIMFVIWYFDYFILLTITFKRIYNILNNKLFAIMLIFFTSFIDTFLIANNYITMLNIYHYSYIIMLIFIILFSFTIKKDNQ